MDGLGGEMMVVVAAEAPRLDLDATLLLQMALFVALWWVLGRFLFRPYMVARRERDRLTQGTRERAAALAARVAELQAEVDAAREAAQCEALSERKALLVEMKRQARETLRRGRGVADAIIAENHADLLEDVGRCRLALDAQAGGLARAVADKLLG